MGKITSLMFFKAWINTVENRKEHLLKIWRSAKEYTSYVMGCENSVIKEVAEKLNLNCYNSDYYSLDTILYKPEDLVPKIQPNTYWFRDIRVAFEHENFFKSGLYQEVSHLLITNCDLKVLVTYPEYDDLAKEELKYLHRIIKETRYAQNISDDESFLIIFGYENGFDFQWEGYIYKQDNWKLIELVENEKLSKLPSEYLNLIQ